MAWCGGAWPGAAERARRVGWDCQLHAWVDRFLVFQRALRSGDGKYTKCKALSFDTPLGFLKPNAERYLVDHLTLLYLSIRLRLKAFRFWVQILKAWQN